MHPIVARIHPSFRTSFFAWAVARSAMLLVLLLRGHNPIPQQLPEGTGAWSLVREVFLFLNANVDMLDQAGGITILALGEFAMWMGGVAVYRFVRRDGLPQTAERATWLWACSPLAVLAPPGSSWIFAGPLAVWALEAVSGSRHVLAGALLSFAILLRPEAIVLAPGLALMSFSKGRASDLGPWLASLVPVLVFSSVILATIFLGDSTRELYAEGTWRDWAWNGWESHIVDIGVMTACGVGLLLALAFFKRVPKAWLAMAIPVLAWPVVQEPSIASVGPLLFCAPLFGYIALLTEDPSTVTLAIS